MKWIWSAIIAVAVSAAASAQSDKGTTEPMKDSKMAMAMTYTGCIESVNHGAEYLLTHVAGDHDMTQVFTLAGRSDLKKHVGWKVTVTGSVSHAMAGAMHNEHDRLAVSSLKVVAKSCS